MTTVTSYKTPQEFLDISEDILEEREIENNLILGLCNGFSDKSKVYDGCVFINVFADNQIQASSIKTISKVILSGTTKDIRHIKSLADYYRDNGIQLTGAFGESFYAFEFSNFYGKRQVGEKKLIVHKLTSVNSLPLASGELVNATMNDIELLTDWTMNFEEDVQSFPKQNREQILNITQRRVGLGDIFKWIDNDEIVSIVAIVRKTKNASIIGLVYTPEKLRGRGYATSCVQKLSELILCNGYKYCGLFTDKSNPASNHIYKKIGYFPILEFTEIEYES